MLLKNQEVVLDVQKILLVCIFFKNLLVQMVLHRSLDDIRVLGWFYLPTHAIKVGSVCTKMLNLFLCKSSRPFDGFGSLGSSGGEFLVLVLDLGVQTVESRKELAFESLFSFKLGIRQSLVFTDIWCD